MGEYTQVHHPVDLISLFCGKFGQPLRHERGVVRQDYVLFTFDVFEPRGTGAGCF